MSKEFTKSYAINRIAELNEQIVEMADNQNQTMKYLNRIRDENNQLKQQLADKDKEIEKLKLQQKHTQQVCNKYHSLYDKRSDSILKLAQIQCKLEQNQKQLAIQELEKAKDLIKHFCEIYSDEFYGVKSQVKGIEQNVCESIDNQIKILKGE